MILFLYRKKEDLFMFCECTCISSDIVILHRLITKIQLSLSVVENTMFLFLRKKHTKIHIESVRAKMIMFAIVTPCFNKNY